MNRSKIYLDYAASTPVDLDVQKAMLPYLVKEYGNPESSHIFGQDAMTAVNRARKDIAHIIGAKTDEIIFTGSATESNNLALRGVVKAAQRHFNISTPRIIVSTIEHDSILETARDLERDGIDVIYISVDKTGIVDIEALEKSLTKSTVIVSIMYVNNVTGAIQPVEKIANIVKRFRRTTSRKKFLPKYPLFHTDAVQAFQYLNCDADNLGVNLMTLSAHKLYGPKGVGVLYVRDLNSPSHFLETILTGGGQEFGLRSATHNVPAIVGCAEALKITRRLRNTEKKKAENLRKYFIHGLKTISPKSEIHDARHQSPGIVNVYIPEFTKDVVDNLSKLGIAVSAGSACSSHSPLASRVLRVMGIPEEKATVSIRISFGKFTTRKQIDDVLKTIKNLINKKV